MEELKLLVATVAGLPTLTVWVLCGYLVYKLTIIGSLYGVIRFGILKFVEWRTMPAPMPAPIQYKMGALTINEDVALALSAQLQRLSKTGYIHTSDVAKLRAAMDYIEQRAKEAKK